MVAAQTDEDRATFAIDPIDIDWQHYLHAIHLPSVIAQGRVRTSPTRKTTVDRRSRAERTILAPQRQLAVFDLENTLLKTNVVENYAWLAMRYLTHRERAMLVARKLPKFPGLLTLDRRDRGDFLRTFYRWYAGAPADRVRQDAWDLFNELMLSNAFPDALRRVRAHRDAGHRTLLITGTLDLIVEPLRPLFDDIVCAKLVERDGVFTGELLDTPPVGEARALLIKDYASRNGLELAECVAYADSPVICRCSKPLVSRGRQPRDPPCCHCPAARLARRTLEARRRRARLPHRLAHRQARMTAEERF